MQAIILPFEANKSNYPGYYMGRNVSQQKLNINPKVTCTQMSPILACFQGREDI